MATEPVRVLGRCGCFHDVAAPVIEDAALAVGQALRKFLEQAVTARERHVFLRLEVAQDRLLVDFGGFGDLLESGRFIALTFEELGGGLFDRQRSARLLPFPQRRFHSSFRY